MREEKSTKNRKKELGIDLGIITVVTFVVLGILIALGNTMNQFALGGVHAWCPFWDVNTTPEVVQSAFPYNVIAYIITGICWGFFEGFNYVVIRDKLSELLPSKYRFLDWGALICAIMCILIHGVVGVTPKAILEMIVTIILIYGMLIVRKETGNAWGCVAIFLLYWNAL